MLSVRVAMMVALLLAMFVAAQSVHADNTFTVDRSDDPDLTLTTADDCTEATANDCSLRGAINAANNTPGADAISFNIPGTGMHTITLDGELGDLPPITEQVIIDGYSQTGAIPATDTSNAVLKIELDGTNAGDGLTIRAANCTVKGLIINHFGNRSVWIDGSGSTGNKVEGNYIGTDAAGTADMGNLYGVYIENQASNNTVGGTEAGARNVISGNVIGVSIFLSGATGNKVMGNYIGTDAAGTQPVGNNLGVLINGASSNTVGGTEAGARNVISGNTPSPTFGQEGDGVYITSPGTMDNKVEGNYIGTDAAGTADMGNAGSGVRIDNQASDNAVGGTDADDGTVYGVVKARNIISGNSGDGVFIGAGAKGNEVRDNFIGTDTSGTQALGNTGNGVEIRGSSSTGNSILSNSIYDSGGLGIDLVGGDETTLGVTRNDNKDPDKGANRLQNSPRLSSTTLSAGQITISGQLNSHPRKAFTIQFFSSPEADQSGNGEGKTFLGQKRIKTSREGKRSFSTTFSPLQPVSSGEKITATVTNNLTGDTSEFSAAMEVP